MNVNTEGTMRKVSFLLVVLCFIFCDKNPSDIDPVNVIKPEITGHPQSDTVNEGQTAIFGVIATGDKPFTYKWMKNGIDISGATDSSYTTPATVMYDNGSTFRCIVSNTSGNAISNSATLTVSAIKPEIIVHPQPVTVNEGQIATFSVVATGSRPLNYLWQKNGADITWVKDSSFTTPVTVMSDSGLTFRCIVSNGAGSDTSNEATLTVMVPNPDPVTDIDGNVYQTVQIGNQVWTVENLRVTRFNDSTPIPNVTINSEWVGQNEPAYCYYNNTTNADTIKKWGALYNWYVVDSAYHKQVAPPGWRVPTVADWDTLQYYLIENGYNWDGSTIENKIAKSLAAKSDWAPSNNPGHPGNDTTTNNSSGFSALPGGFRYDFASFDFMNRKGHWWSATNYGTSSAYCRHLFYLESTLNSGYKDKKFGYSVRLVRDAD